MKKNSLIVIAGWATILAIANLLMFCIEHAFTTTFWVAFAFIWASFIFGLILQLAVWRRNGGEPILASSTTIISSVHLILQLPFAIIFSIGASDISVRATVLVNGLTLLVFVLLTLGTLAGNDHIRKVNSRQEDHHQKLNRKK